MEKDRTYILRSLTALVKDDNRMLKLAIKKKNWSAAATTQAYLNGLRLALVLVLTEKPRPK